MLVQGTYSSGGARISQDLLTTYVRYKQDTRAIISWLLQHGTSRFRSLKTISIRDLMGLAEVVQKKAVVMPDSIDFQFRQAIAARTEISRHFRRKSEAFVDNQETTTQNHEFFTTSLVHIYTGLCKCCAKSEADCNKAKTNGCDDGSKSGPTNRFEILNPGHHDLDCPLSNTNAAGQRGDRTEKVTTSVKTCVSPHLADPLSDLFEIQKELQEMNDLLLTVTEVWEQAGRQDIPIVVAAFITNAVFASFEGIEQRLTLLCNASNPDILQRQVSQMRENLGVDETKGLSSFKYDQVEALQSPWHLLLQMKRGYTEKATNIVKCETRSTSQITVRKGPSSAPMDRECYATIVDNIKHHITAKVRPTSIVLTSTPLFADVGYLMTHEANDTNGLRCAFGLQILLEAYKSYLLSPTGPPPSGCRLQALKFTQEVASSLDPVLADPSMPCRCCQTLASHLETFQLDLKAFYQAKVFDLYFQSPWVSGSHILEVLETSFYFGLRLFSYRHYCGAVLHVYNVLRLLSNFPAIPLLDHLCALFADVLFPGGRPDRNFKACCMRHMGGRLRFPSAHSSSPAHRSGAHRMEIPAPAARATAGFGSLRTEANDARFRYRKICLLHHVKHDRKYHLDAQLWKRVHTLASSSSSSGSSEKANEEKPPQHTHRRSSSNNSTTSKCPHHNHTSTHLHHHPPNLRTLLSATLPELTGPFPIAKVNFFAVYMACVRIVENITKAVHEDEGGQGTNLNEEKQDGRCLCFLEIIMGAADRWRERGETVGWKGVRKACEKGIWDELGDIDIQKFLWNGV